jgi:hypothetical protein
MDTLAIAHVTITLGHAGRHLEDSSSAAAAVQPPKARLCRNSDRIIAGKEGPASLKWLKLI